MASQEKRIEVLTREGGELESWVTPDMRKVLAYLSDGTLLVSKLQENNPLVTSFEARLIIKGRDCNIVYVEDGELSRKYKESASGKIDEKAAKIRDTEMMKIARDLLKSAVRIGASDIHIVASARLGTLIIMRVQGALEDFNNNESASYGRQLCRTFYQALSDGSATYNETVPQDARIGDRNSLPQGLDGVRIGTSPLTDGTYMVLRLLYDAAAAIGLEDLGFDPEAHIQSVELMKTRSSGLNIVCGPTGSGKSTTLQEIIGQIIDDNNGEKNVITVEDPVEYPIYGRRTKQFARQTSVAQAKTEAERSVAMQQSIRAALRLDPDIIMIGETRDEPSAQLSFTAAMTGHQVWTTLHTNDVMGAFDRLIDIGVPISLVTDPKLITGIIFQRLVRKLCDCKIKMTDALAQGLIKQKDFNRLIDVIDTQNAYITKPRGCDKCNHRGNVGRVAVVEIVTPDVILMEHVKNGDRVKAIEHWRAQGGRTVVEHVIDKINKGLVDPYIAERQVDNLSISKMLQDHQILKSEIAKAVGAVSEPHKVVCEQS